MDRSTLEDRGDAYRRFRALCEISKHLTTFDGRGLTMGEVLGIATKTLPVASAVLVRSTTRRPRLDTWRAVGVSARKLRAAKQRARERYAYLVDSSVEVLQRELEEEESAIIPGSYRGDALDGSSVVFLPLAIDERGIFGALQLQSAERLDEEDLLFVDAIARMLAMAIDRYELLCAARARRAGLHTDGIGGWSTPIAATGSVLIVDDDEDTRLLVGAMLREQGFEVVGTPDARAALEMLQRMSPRPCLVLVDLTMPGMDGPTFIAEEAKDPLGTVPIVVVSGRHDIDEIAKRLSVAGCLRKPFDEAELNRVVQRCRA